MIMVLSAVVFAGAGITEKASGAVFPDIPVDSLFYPHIERLFQEHFVSGDTRTGTFRPNDTINRAEFAKITAYTRLAEEYGVQDNWDKKDNLAMAFEIFGLLKPYFGCGQGACESIGGAPFTDVRESDPKCMDDIGNPDACEPWFSRYVYYAVSRGYIKGYADPDGTRSCRPTENILRIHALKMIIADNGNILPERDPRYQRLLKQAVSLKSYTPKCLKGAENYIKDLNGGNTADAEKLLKYALLADRLDLFGNRCEVFGSFRTPAERAHFLQRPLTRGETPRYFAITTAYSPVRPDTADTTINTAAENSNSPAGVPSYKMPVYEKTPLYNRQGGDESVWGDNGDTGAPAPEQPPVQKTITPPVSKMPVYNPDAPYTATADPSAGLIKPKPKAVAVTSNPKKGLPDIVVTSNEVIPLTDEYGEPCGTIPAGTEFSLLIARKGEDGEFYQYTDYDLDRNCRFPCDKLMTPLCREAVAEDNAENPFKGNAVVGTEIVAATDISTYFKLIKMPVPDVYNVYKDTIKQVKDIKENPGKYIKIVEEKAQAASMADGSYEIVGISPAWIQAERPNSQTFVVRVKNTGGKEWKQDGTFLTIDTVWLAARNMERRERGFSRNEDIPSLRLKDSRYRFTEKNVQPDDQATFAISVPPNQPARAQIRLMLNGKSASNIDAVYLTAVKEEKRGFRTSAGSVWFQKLPVLNMGKVKNKRGELEDRSLAPYWSNITTPDTPVTVLGHAVIGEYADTFKTYMWYPAEYNGDRGFVVASSVHAEQINNRNLFIFKTNEGTLWGREKYTCGTALCNRVMVRLPGIAGTDKVRGITIHFPIANSEAKNILSGNKDTPVGFQYAVGKDGEVAQMYPDYLWNYHAANDAISEVSVSIEVNNWGVAMDYGKKENNIITYRNYGDTVDIPNSEIVNARYSETYSGISGVTKKPEEMTESSIWKVWSSDKNITIAGLGDTKNRSQEIWHKYSDTVYQGLASVTVYIEERYDIPHKFFFMGEAKNEAEGLSYYPSDKKEQTAYDTALLNFHGLYGHHNANGKYDPGPHFDVNKLNEYWNQNQ